jgi:hypothetical protein
MKIGEILKKENVGKLYSDGSKTYKVVKKMQCDDEEAYDLERTIDGLLIGDIYYTSKILSIDFTTELIDWENISVDTKILVSINGKEWHRRYFAKYIKDEVYVWDYGATSFSSNHCTKWAYAKLYEEEE